jgi:hypothetical protein
MNKFEALKQFQAWPPEWQRLCAEYWAETDEGSDMRLAADREILRKVDAVWCHADQIEAAKKLLEPVATLAHESVSARLAQPKAAKVAAKTRARTKYTLQELDFLDNLIYSELGPSIAVKNFCKRFPNSGHPKESLTTKFHKRRQELKKKGELA